MSEQREFISARSSYMYLLSRFIFNSAIGSSFSSSSSSLFYLASSLMLLMFSSLSSESSEESPKVKPKASSFTAFEGFLDASVAIVDFMPSPLPKPSLKNDLSLHINDYSVTELSLTSCLSLFMSSTWR